MTVINNNSNSIYWEHNVLISYFFSFGQKGLEEEEESKNLRGKDLIMEKWAKRQ